MNFTRRDFVRASALGMVAAMLPESLHAAPRARADFTLLRRNVGIFTERGGTMGWLVNNDGVLVIDSQFADTAPIFLDGLRQRTSRPIDLLINTHHHPDHTGGNSVMRPHVGSIVAHERAVENQRTSARQRNAEDEQAYADVTLKDAWDTEVGDEKVNVKFYGAAHTGGDVLIHFERANVVHLGDLVNNRGFPNVDAPAGGSVLSWMRVLEAVAPAFPSDTQYVFGHNEAGFPPIGTVDDLYYQRDYFSAVIDVAQKALRAGQTRDQATAIESLAGYTHFGGTPSRLGLAVGVAFDELSQDR
ncbi:MAG: MBL fold metallo-hydrolase [Gemmatimonadota bacterium]|nr:MBL fold metallo-hydrolase [Gemmatimonadota bacterium]